MQELILKFMGEYGCLAVFLLILAENLFPPIPSEVILTFGGVMTTCTPVTPVGVVAASTAGSVLGAVVLYLAGVLIPVDRFGRLLDGRMGRLLHIVPEDLELSKTWFLRRGNGAVFLGRLVPIVRSLVSIPAGMARMRPGPFLLYTAAGSFLWNTALVYLGRAAGSSWEKAAETYGIYSDLLLMALGTGAVLALMIHKARKNKKSE